MLALDGRWRHPDELSLVERAQYPCTPELDAVRTKILEAASSWAAAFILWSGRESRHCVRAVAIRRYIVLAMAMAITGPVESDADSKQCLPLNSVCSIVTLDLNFFFFLPVGLAGRHIPREGVTSPRVEAHFKANVLCVYVPH